MKRWIAVLAMGALLAGCGEPSAVTYRITGTTGNVDVTLRNASGGTQQINIKPPYTLDFKANSGQTLYISGQNKWERGVVTCEILIDGKTAQTASSNAAYGIATCSGRL